MTRTGTATTGQPVPLEAFLADLDPEIQGELRAAAARIDALARTADALAHIERKLAPWAVIAGLLFAVGLWGVINPGTIGAPAITLCLTALPLVAAVYAWQIKPRTQADNAATEINRQQFLPQGGLYFPQGQKDACVVAVDWTPPPVVEKTPVALRDPRKPENRIGSSW